MILERPGGDGRTAPSSQSIASCRPGVARVIFRLSASGIMLIPKESPVAQCFPKCVVPTSAAPASHVA